MSTINANTSGLFISIDASNTLQIQTGTANSLLISYVYGPNSAIANFNSTSAIVLPQGNQSFLPTTPTLGMMHYDTPNSHFLVYKSTGWATFI
jgi:hypothetical protein